MEEHITLAPWQMSNGKWRSRCTASTCGCNITADSFDEVADWAEAHDAISMDREYV